MERRVFDFLFTELSVAVGELVPRYALWLHLQDLGADPSDLSGRELLEFHDEHMHGFLASCGMRLRDGRARRLRRTLRRYDPRHASPEEIMLRIFSPPDHT